MGEVAPTTDAWERYYRADQRSLVAPLKQGDREWLAKTLRNCSLDPERRMRALQALVGLWMQGGRNELELDALRLTVQDNAYLAEELHRRSTPPTQNSEFDPRQRNERRQKLAAERRERQRLDGWVRWRAELVTDPEGAFAPEHVSATIRNLHAWLEARSERRSRYNVWDADALRQAYSPDIATRAATAFRTLWRGNPPVLWSQRTAEERNRAPYTWAEALTGIAAEAETSGWAALLSQDEARTAAAYATIELNGFPSWLDDLAAAHPAIVEEVIAAELSAEITRGVDQQHLPTLQALAYSSDSMKRLLAPRLLMQLAEWPSTLPENNEGQQSAHHLEEVLRVLDVACKDCDHATIAASCDTRFFTDLTGPLAPAWLQGLFRHNPQRGTEALDTALTALPESDRSSLAIAVFANLFGERNSLPDFRDESERALVLGRLLRLVYGHVRLADDQRHDQAYTPNLRDRAQDARNFLFNAVLDTPGPEAHRVVSELATDPLFAGLADRLRMLARERAAKDAEGCGMTPAEVVALEKRAEAPPIDRDGLFTVMVDRLDDLAHDIAHDDFTDRRTLQTIRDESEMQRNLARRLREMNRSAYTISREDEVADLKRTDIRLAATRGVQKAVIEVKIADKRWSLTDLAQALRTQLVGQYLRHDTCKAGCLLLTYDGSKKYWQNPKTRRRLLFTEMLEYLAGLASEIERECGYSLRLAVRGLDLTDTVGAK
jgi:hypothetical protein